MITEFENKYITTANYVNINEDITDNKIKKK